MNRLRSFCAELINTMYTSVCGIHLVFLRYSIRQNVAAGAGGDVGIGEAAQYRRRGRRGRGLVGILQLLPVELPLLGTSVLKPDLHLKHRHKHNSVKTEEMKLIHSTFCRPA